MSDEGTARQRVTVDGQRLVPRRPRPRRRGAPTPTEDAADNGERLAMLEQAVMELARRVEDLEADRGSPAQAEFIESLRQVQGVGRARAEALAEGFGRVERLAAASVEDIVATAGVGRAVAQRVLDHVRT